MTNYSQVIEFLLIGFPGLQKTYHIPVSIVMFIVYIVSLCVNGTVISLVYLKEHLHQPMYIFIANLALSDLLFDTITLPKIIAKYWDEDAKMSFSGCYLQTFLVHFLGTVDSFLLMLMAADRCVAICKPLRYAAMITKKITTACCCILWLMAAVAGAANPIISFMNFHFCGQNEIYGLFCSSMTLYPLSCTDVSSNQQTRFLIGIVSSLLVPLAVIILSYIIIILTVQSMVMTDNWRKLFYTCTTHLLVISLYYVPRAFVYFTSYFNLVLKVELSVLILFLYTYIPHLANPFIYCLRNKDIKVILVNVFGSKNKLGC
ncbi:hypothetical protein GDO86_019669 [Hymenochirus boettgeri]|uniref:Olfactory receptor n=1 Tax=Hymenochirus boettgeri TaxID=247094 RepID=A0A8T2IJR9_9PIPI|nr:hypothetical protein GDO86_019669 [Hymenochirus boettgeri]